MRGAPDTPVVDCPVPARVSGTCPHKTSAATWFSEAIYLFFDAETMHCFLDRTQGRAALMLPVVGNA